MEEADEILFDKYLDGDLPNQVRTAFEERLRNDAPFAEAYRLHIAARTGIKQQGRSTLRTELAGIGAAVIPIITPNSYRPTLSHGSSIFKWLRRLFSIGFVVAGVSLLVIYQKQLKVMVIEKRELVPAQNDTITKHDTTKHKVKSTVKYHIEKKVIYDTVRYNSPPAGAR